MSVKKGEKGGRGISGSCDCVSVFVRVCARVLECPADGGRKRVLVSEGRVAEMEGWVVIIWGLGRGWELGVRRGGELA